MPFAALVTIKGIEIQKKKAAALHPGALCEISLHLPSGFDPNYIKSGNVLCDPRYPIN
jgi:hypothetical protein